GCPASLLVTGRQIHRLHAPSGEGADPRGHLDPAALRRSKTVSLPAERVRGVVRKLLPGWALPRLCLQRVRPERGLHRSLSRGRRLLVVSESDQAASEPITLVVNWTTALRR